nr:hypothetical protein [uncultured Flavobacterium sp.]
MPERLREIPDEIWNFLIKTLPFSLAALAISISIQIKNKTASLVNSFLSIVIGVSCAWITGNFINSHFSVSTAPMMIGVVTIAGEKVAYWLIYKFQFDVLGQAIIDYLVSKIKKK